MGAEAMVRGESDLIQNIGQLRRRQIMKREQANDAIELAYHGRVYTINAGLRWDGQSWQFGCRQLGLVSGSYATAQDALLAGIAMVVQGGSTRRADLVA